MRKSLLALSLVAAAATAPVQAEYLYGFGSMYLDYQKWDHGTENKAEDRNQAVIGIEGGAAFDWGQIYGFYDYEGVDRAHDKRGASLKGSIHYNLGETGASLYAQVYNTDGDAFAFHEQNRVVGLGYTGLSGDGWAFTPFIGAHQVNTSGVVGKDSSGKDVSGAISGANGGMAGWVGFYNTDIAGQSFTFSSWGEYEFGRNEHYADNQGGKTGLNGSLNAMWNVTEDWSTGVLYRFTHNKLGIQGYNDLVIYRINYKF
ncbi:outer membrane protein OmpK [Vibrio tapetis subsp. quintayensis]|uniref:outer membrane protein OmpK n=1 Tax=Vibrio tapetis TaxID=52443 RepID=UPI0025B5E57A|nr:outer membrane protein OmpK [Vibrio tapetis]MDN3681392.1 outer membrane protein OmpK [Vibrio tapetis subsp. quintayensis]